METGAGSWERLKALVRSPKRARPLKMWLGPQRLTFLSNRTVPAPSLPSPSSSLSHSSGTSLPSCPRSPQRYALPRACIHRRCTRHARARLHCFFSDSPAAVRLRPPSPSPQTKVPTAALVDAALAVAGRCYTKRIIGHLSVDFVAYRAAPATVVSRISSTSPNSPVASPVASPVCSLRLGPAVGPRILPREHVLPVNCFRACK